jgi:hypothetical protein
MLTVAMALLGNAIEGPIGSDRRIYKSLILGSVGTLAPALLVDGQCSDVI